jgi:hypothetical protein
VAGPSGGGGTEDGGRTRGRDDDDDLRDSRPEKRARIHVDTSADVGMPMTVNRARKYSSSLTMYNIGFLPSNVSREVKSLMAASLSSCT